MISVGIQLKRQITKLVKTITNDFTITHGLDGGIIYFKSNLGLNYFDKKVCYKFENSTNNYDDYKLIMSLDWDNNFNSIDNTIVTLK